MVAYTILNKLLSFKHLLSINFNPPLNVRRSARRGLELRKKFGRGGLSSQIAGKLGIGSGIIRAVNLSKGSKLSPRTVKRTNSIIKQDVYCKNVVIVRFPCVLPQD